MKPKLLSRDEFREGVFQRDGHKCVFCEKPAVDAHHIIERRLWNDSGYYLENGASVCEEHHLECERTNISVEQVREKCRITKIIIPDHLYEDQIYDKWGNIILANGQRLKGELFYDPSVQKILVGVLDLFTDYAKYPRTYHLPWTGSMNQDDKMIKSTDCFKGKRVIVSEKMDGENTSMYCDHIHARSIESENHISRTWVKNFWGGICQDIPKGWRVCGENLWAKHSIQYSNLPTYLMGFSVWNDRNECLNWDETLIWFNLLGMQHVPILYDGIYDEKYIKTLYDPKTWNTIEGYVIRVADKFSYGDFRNSVAKYVRDKHIQTTKHWMWGQPIERNLLRSE